MGWNFWKKKEQPKRETDEEWRARIDAERAARDAQIKAEWDALPDHRKAARIEYQHFKKMARKPPRDALYNLALAQQQGLLCSGSQGVYITSPYAQMNSEIGRIMALEQAGFR